MNEIVNRAKRAVELVLRRSVSMSLASLEEQVRLHANLQGDQWRAIVGRALYSLEDENKIQASLEQDYWRVVWIGH